MIRGKNLKPQSVLRIRRDRREKLGIPPVRAARGPDYRTRPSLSMGQ